MHSEGVAPVVDRTPTTTPRGVPGVELEGVVKRFGAKTAVDGLALSIPAGATYGVLGPNGAGKTTTIRMILRIIEPDSGSIRLFGRPIEQHALDRVGYLPEERGLYKRMKVREMLEFLAELKGVPPRVSRPRILPWLERLDLADRAESRVQELSKGMQQKIQFIGAVVHEPELVILDEPFSGLDPINQRVLKEIVAELRTQGRTIIFSTHLIEHAERLCDHVCIIARGQKVLDGAIADVKRDHGGDFVTVDLERWTPEAEAVLRASPVAERVRLEGTHAEVALRPDGDPQGLLEALVASGIRLRRFEYSEPSLEQIFVERVGAAREVLEEATTIV